MIVLEDGEGGFFERSRVMNPAFRAPDGFFAGTLSTERLEQHFGDERRLKVQGRQGLQYFAEAPRGADLCSLMVTRMTMTARTIGYMAVCAFSPEKAFDEGQRKLLRIVADRAAASIENAKLYENLKGTFRQTIRGLANAIDKMDRYTSGHSERVAMYSQLLAQRLGMTEPQIEIVRQSALMHDIGKIGCVLNLNKPGILSEREYEIFKRHPGYGKDILQPIEFLQPLIPGVHCHHERWDGNGYPLGLKAKDIPAMARIISVADVYDAMTSDRAYRKALPHLATMAEITRCAGSQFDPDVSREFVEVIAQHRRECKERGEPLPE
jgi:HD-GYP domain-containing protein (c-di-GMP phosphodiesterase class II)